MPLMVSPTPMTLHSYPTGHYTHPSITQNEIKLLKNMFPQSLPRKLPTLHNNAPYGLMNGVQLSPYTIHSVLHPHDPKHQPYGPPKPLIRDQKWEIIVEKTVHLISAFTVSHSTQMLTLMHPKDQFIGGDVI
jgi:hypothetical protein